MHFIATHPLFTLVALVILAVVPPLIASALAYSRDIKNQAANIEPEEVESFREMLKKAGLI